MRNKIMSVVIVLLPYLCGAQETRPDIPPSDEGVREQSEQPDMSEDEPENHQRLQVIDKEFEALTKEAEDSGRDTERYYKLIQEYHIIRQRISSLIQDEAAAETELEQEMRLLESQLKMIRKEPGPAEPGKRKVFFRRQS
jgi:hypothetical protein